jgi:predicted transcriptional regulator of viral defense system
MKKKLNPLFVLKILKEKDLNIFTPLDFKRLFGGSDFATAWFIKSCVRRNIFIKIRRGLYTVANFPANSFSIANRLYEPSYISFDTAMSFHGIIPETIYSVTSATPKTSRELEANGISYDYHKIKKEAYGGYEPIKYLDKTILMAEPEKAIADYLYFVALNERGLYYERIDLSKINKGKLLKYVKLFNNAKAIKLIDEIYAEFRNPKEIY